MGGRDLPVSFNHYAGSLRHATFHSVTTHGGEGRSLVKGAQVTMESTALSVIPSGRLGSVTIAGRVRTLGGGMTTVEIRE